jgi:hypothetical protein
MLFGSTYLIIYLPFLFLHTQVEFYFETLQGGSGHHNLFKKMFYDFHH